jgi:hypothetical protein
MKNGLAMNCLTHLLSWSWRWESNPQPADYKSAALPLSYASRMVEMPCIMGFFAPSRHFRSAQGLPNAHRIMAWNKITFASLAFLFDPSAQEAFTETDAVFETASV